MKTMTCKQLGGPCDHAHHGQTADEVIKAQDRHLKEMVAGGDTSHAPALKEMKGRWKHPISGRGWYGAANRGFAPLPEDCPGATSADPMLFRSLLAIRRATGPLGGTMRH